MQVDKNEFFRQATLKICGSLNITKAMSNFMEYLKTVIPLSGMCIGLFDEEGKTMKTVAAAGNDPTHRPPDTVRFPEDVWKNFGHKIDLYMPLCVVNDVMNQGDMYEGRFMESLFGTRDLSAIFMDLNLEGNRTGCFIPYAHGRNRYKIDHARLLAMIHDPLAIATSNILRYQEVLRLKDMLADDNRYFQNQLLELSGDHIIGANSGLKSVMKMVHQVAPLDSPVLLLGETGVGKEVIANAIHMSSSRRKGPFIKVNCGAIPLSLMDSELFGHEKGAFTGAIELKRGRFERADGGTIFLDEIGDLPLPAQVRLLRVLQTREFERVGGSQTVKADVRVISATNKNLAQMVQNKKFREDLWYRLNVYPITIPPLRRRKEDVPLLVQYFFDKKSRDLRIHKPLTIDPAVINRLESHHWPGNVRELENWVERALIQSQGDGAGLLENDMFSSRSEQAASELESAAGPDGVFSSLEQVIERHIAQALKQCGGRIEGPNGAAVLLDVHPSTLRAKMRKLGVKAGMYKKT